MRSEFQLKHYPDSYPPNSNFRVQHLWLAGGDCDYSDDHRRLMWAIKRLPQDRQVDGVIGLMDSSKPAAFPHARSLLHQPVAHPNSRGKPFLVF
jgi:hypothetical protein